MSDSQALKHVRHLRYLERHPFQPKATPEEKWVVVMHGRRFEEMRLRAVQIGSKVVGLDELRSGGR